MTTPTDAGTGALIAAATVAFSFGGVDMFHLAMGAACYVVGAACRAGLKIGAALESTPPQRIGAQIAVLLVSPMLGGFASLVMFLGAHVIGFEGDAAIALVLALGGFRGNEGIQAIVSLVSKSVPEKLGGAPNNQETKP